MRAIVLFQFAFLFCLSSAVGVKASLIVGPSITAEMVPENLIGASEVPRTSSSPETSNQTPQPPEPETPYFKFLGSSCMLAGVNGGGMSGSGVPPMGGGNTTSAIPTKEISLVDHTMVVWLARADWLAIPMPPSGSLLRPPQEDLTHSRS